MGEQDWQRRETARSFDASLARAQSSRVGRPARLAIGSKLQRGRFEIARRIGEGGMGVVYEAFDAERRVNVALKTLSRFDAGGIYRFKNEFRVLADVSHPNLVRQRELFADDDLWFFTMDLVDGMPFDDWVRPGSDLDAPRLRSSLAQLVDAVLTVHDAGRVHRDLKPSNVLVTNDGRVVVLDFGLAVDPAPGGVGQTLAEHEICGTPEYMAPEQAAGQQATAASDVYSLGVMLFEALTGRLPFEGHGGALLLTKQQRAAPLVAARNPRAPRDLSELCGSMLARKPSERPHEAALREQLSLSRERIAIPAPRPRAASPGALELLGRDAELSALRDAYRTSCDGAKPAIVLLSEDSAMGKCALLELFLAELRDEGRAVVLAGRCHSRESVPFKGFDALIDELSRYLRRQSAEELAGLIPRDAHALRTMFPILGRIDAIALAPVRKVADTYELRQRAFLALGELLGRIRDRRPLVLALDDLQWGDPESTALLLHLLRQPDAPCALWIASHRGEGAHSAVLRPLYETLEGDARFDALRLESGKRMGALCA